MFILLWTILTIFPSGIVGKRVCFQTIVEHGQVLDRLKSTITYTGCIKKMVIELWSALASSLYNLQKSFFHSRKDQAFSFRMSPFL